LSIKAWNCPAIASATYRALTDAGAGRPLDDESGSRLAVAQAAEVVRYQPRRDCDQWPPGCCFRDAERFVGP
jgi:hypothetical protein